MTDEFEKQLIENIKDYCARIVSSARVIMNDIDYYRHHRSWYEIDEMVKKIEKYYVKLAGDWALLKDITTKQKVIK